MTKSASASGFREVGIQLISGLALSLCTVPYVTGSRKIPNSFAAFACDCSARFCLPASHRL